MTRLKRWYDAHREGIWTIIAGILITFLLSLDWDSVLDVLMGCQK